MMHLKEKKLISGLQRHLETIRSDKILLKVLYKIQLTNLNTISNLGAILTHDHYTKSYIKSKKQKKNWMNK